jgi:3-dehydroquinate synthase
MEERVEVNLGDRSYPIVIGCGVLDTLGDACKAQGLSGRALVVTDSNVGDLYAERALASLNAAGYQAALAEIPAGEPSKSHEQLIHLYSCAVEAGLDRKAFVVALGGGVVGDLAGFLAASFLRGLTLVQVPTSLLAMVDSAVGGKTGINLPHGKNLVGAFHQPALVLADIDALKTLPVREFAAGMAEVIKYGVIRDVALFEMLEQGAEQIQALNPEVLISVVRRSCEIKAEVVAEDEREGGLRAILNYGHTLGHAVEQVTGYKQYLHGEALGIGTAFAAHLSARVHGLSPEEVQRQIDLLERYGLPIRDSNLDWAALRAAMSVDKKSVDAIPRFVLADRLGHVDFGCEVSEMVVQEVWNEMV